MSKVWLMAAAGAMLSTAAMAQPAVPGRADGVRQQISANLQKSGYTDVKIVPDSFLVQAKDPNGNPVLMMINPNSITEVMDHPPVVGQGAAGGPAVTAPGGSNFTTVVGADRLGSQVIGLDIYNGDMKDIGAIKDIAYENGMLKAYIVGVGGFLGMGEHDVAVKPSSVHITWDGQAHVWHARMNTTVAELKAAPEYKAVHPG